MYISSASNDPYVKCCSSAKPSCCEDDDSKPPRWIKKVDLICRIALGIFAVCLKPIYMGISMGVGTTVGAGYAMVRYYRDKSLFPQGESKPVCAQGYMEFLTGMRFPPLIGSVVTASFIAAHMRHDPQFYVPFCGFFIGFWIGRETVSYVKDLSRWVFRAYTSF